MWLSKCMPGCRQVLWKKLLWEEMNQPGAPWGCGVLSLMTMRGELAGPPHCQLVSIILALLVAAFRCPQFSLCCGAVRLRVLLEAPWHEMEAPGSKVAGTVLAAAP